MTEVVNSKESIKLPFQIGEISNANIQQLRMINLKTLPVKYSDKFYRELISNYTTEYMRFAFWDGFVVGAVCARIETHDSDPALCKLYIMTINVLAAYRKKGIASELLKFVIDKAQKDEKIVEVYLHVQLGNDDAKRFYLKHEFQEFGIIKDYYKRIEPNDCYILKKTLK